MTLELTVQRQAGSGNLLIYLVNYSGQNDNVVDEAIPIHGIELRLSGLRAVSARTLVAGNVLEIGRLGECQTLKLPPVGAFEGVSITVGP